MPNLPHEELVVLASLLLGLGRLVSRLLRQRQLLGGLPRARLRSRSTVMVREHAGSPSLHVGHCCCQLLPIATVLEAAAPLTPERVQSRGVAGRASVVVLVVAICAWVNAEPFVIATLLGIVAGMSSLWSP